MKTNEKIDLLNSMHVLEVDVSGEDLLYVLVEDNKENRNKLSQVVDDVYKYRNRMASHETIDITLAAFEYAGANSWSTKHGFYITKEGVLN